MALLFLYPNAVISNDLPASGWPSSLTIDQVLADSSYLTRLRHVNTAPGNLTVVGFDTYTLQANERIAGLRIWMQLGQTRSGLFEVRLKNSSAMRDAVYAPVSFPTSNRLPNISKWITKDATDGLEWTQADLDGLEASIDWMNPGGTFDARLYDLAVELDIRPQPTALNVFPAISDIIDIDRPRFIWRVQQEADVTQNRYTLKVFTKAIVEGGGYDPDISTAVGTVAKVTSSTRFDWLAPLPALIFGDDYYWTVKTEVKFLNGLWASEWSTPTPFSLNDPPTVDVLTPTGVVSDTNTPLVTWDFTDPELSPQSEALVRIFAQPGGTWVGFDPDVAVPLFEAAIMGDDEEVLCTTRLANAGTYRAYVKAAHRLSNGATLWGSWDFEDFTTSYSAPAAPTLVAVTDNERVMITMTPPAEPWTPDIDYFEIQRSLDSGVTWEIFRYGTLVKSTAFPDNPAALVIYDYEVPYYIDVQYRAFSVSTDLGVDLLSASSNVVTVQIDQQVVWIKDPSNSTLNANFRVEGSWLIRSKRRARTFHEPLGRSLPVVIRGTATASSFSVTLVVIGEENWDKLMALIGADRTLYVQTPKGSWYVEIAGDVGIQDRLWDRRAGEDDVWKIDIPLQEVDFA